MARVSFCGNIWGSALERGSGVVGRVTGTNCVGGLIGYMAAKGRSILNGFFTGRVADERHGSTVAVVGGGGSILDWDYRENFPYDLVWSKPGAWILCGMESICPRACRRRIEATVKRTTGRRRVVVLVLCRRRHTGLSGRFLLYLPENQPDNGDPADTAASV